MTIEEFNIKFTNWILSITKDFKTSFLEASRPLPSNPEELISVLTTVEAWNARIGEILAEANSYLDLASKLYMPSKSNGMTEFERKSNLDSEVALIREWRNKAENLTNAIKQKLILGESILRYYSIFKDHMYKSESETPF